MQISRFDRLSKSISRRFLLLFLLLIKNNWAVGFEKYLRHNCISLDQNKITSKYDGMNPSPYQGTKTPLQSGTLGIEIMLKSF